MSSAEYQELGKRYYKQKEYQKAVDAFTEGIESITIPTVGMLNNRAASFEKLENFNMACKDGRHMIKLDKSDARVGRPVHSFEE
jgi:F-box/TPR repeat protein Pof3